ncbi:MAG: hypothetical protein LPD71_07735, partial [Shewanella sp.]|nr:hypothetical protein [Shewanella sp.]MCF1438624.1 hypothetical protein [Shewanella sp.]
ASEALANFIHKTEGLSAPLGRQGRSKRDLLLSPSWSGVVWRMFAYGKRAYEREAWMPNWPFYMDVFAHDFPAFKRKPRRG